VKEFTNNKMKIKIERHIDIIVMILLLIIYFIVVLFLSDNGL